MFVEVRNAVKKIEENTILSNINISFEKGKIYGIIGKNGSGKTMLLKAICGLVRLNAGEILVGDRMLHDRQDFPESVGVLIENPSFIGNYSGYKNLKILADINHKISGNEIVNYMEKFQLNPMDKKKVRKYSLGMKQKLGIIAAVMEKPELILLDEPTNALDQESVYVLNEILLTAKKRGSTVIIASHDSVELEKITDEQFIIDAGRLIADKD